MNYIFYQTKTKYTNSGDALINSTLITKLREYGEIKANCGNDVPDEFIAELGIEQRERLAATSEIKFAGCVLRAAVSAKRNGDKIYLFSGLGDSAGGDRKTVIRNYVASFILGAYRIAGVHVVRIGRSFGELTPSMKKSERFRSHFITDYYVRDSLSLRRCYEMGIKKAKVCPDLAWLHDSAGVRIKNNSNEVMLNFRVPGNCNKSGFEQELIKALKRVIEEIQQCLKEPIKIIVCYQVDEDKELAHFLYDNMKNLTEGGCIQLVSQKLKLSDMTDYYSQCRFNISNRMHSLFYGYKYGSCPIALIDPENPAHNKIVSTIRDNDLNEMLVDLNDGDIEKKTMGIVENERELFQKVVNKEAENSSKISMIIDEIFAER